MRAEVSQLVVSSAFGDALAHLAKTTAIQLIQQNNFNFFCLLEVEPVIQFLIWRDEQTFLNRRLKQHKNCKNTQIKQFEELVSHHHINFFFKILLELHFPDPSRQLQFPIFPHANVFGQREDPIGTRDLLACQSSGMVEAPLLTQHGRQAWNVASELCSTNWQPLTGTHLLRPRQESNVTLPIFF